ncbi:MAG TPA: hypothetical protein VM364_05790 [Vicinamibacterales bacterium]|nr:hypothetical protein [Vicinamibacterales bacterium]
MRAITLVVDVILGLALGGFLYAVTIALVPPLQGGVALAFILMGGVIAVALGRSGGSFSLHPSPLQGSAASRWTLDRALAADLRSATAPRALIRAAIGWLAGSLVLAALVPLLAARGASLPRWAAWLIVLGAVAIALAPGFRRPR